MIFLVSWDSSKAHIPIHILKIFGEFNQGISVEARNRDRAIEIVARDYGLNRYYLRAKIR